MPLLILPVNHVQQQQAGECLPACVAMVLDYLGTPVAYRKLVKVLETIPNVGTPSFKIRNLARIGIIVDYNRGTLAALQSFLLKNQPCIIFVQTKDLPYRNDDTAHAVVLVGMDEKGVYVDDPEFSESPLYIPVGDFDLAWLERDEMYAVITREPN